MADPVLKMKAYQRTQAKGFRNWVNLILKKRKMHVKDLVEDFKDGIKLINLVEVLQKKNVKKYNKKISVQMQALENLNIALTALKRDKVKLVNIGSQDLYDGNVNLSLGLIWTLILTYHINELDFLDELEEENDKEQNKTQRKSSIATKGLSKMTGKQKLLYVVNDIVSPWDLKAKNFTSSLADGKILTCLAYTRAPTKIANPKNLGNDKLKNVENALKVLEKEFNVPHVIDAADIVNSPDEKTEMTLIGYVLKGISQKDQVVFHPDQEVEGGVQLEEGGQLVQGGNLMQGGNLQAMQTGGDNEEELLEGGDTVVESGNNNFGTGNQSGNKGGNQSGKKGANKGGNTGANSQGWDKEVQRLPRKEVKRVRKDVKVPDEVPVPAKYPKSQLFTRFVEIGRVVVLNHGLERGKLAVIIDVVDANSVLIHGPCTDVKRQPISLKRILLTDIVIPVQRNARYKTLEKAWLESRAQDQWNRTAWAKKLAARKRKAELTDFDRFKVANARSKRAKLIREKKKQLKSK